VSGGTTVEVVLLLASTISNAFDGGIFLGFRVCRVARRSEQGRSLSLTLLSQRLNARGGRGRRYGVGGRVEVWGRRERGRVYEAYEVKNKRQKLRCLLLRRKKKIIIFLFMM